jgi:hypothetical protein
MPDTPEGAPGPTTDASQRSTTPMNPVQQWCLINLLGPALCFACLALGGLGFTLFLIGQSIITVMNCSFAIRTFRGSPWIVLAVALGSCALQVAIVLAGCLSLVRF